MIKYSIIICSYNRFYLLEETIESILKDVKHRNDTEILIVDNNSTDSTSSLKYKYEKHSFIKYFLEVNQGLSNARNRGIKESKGEILVYLDDDIELVKDYFNTCDEIFSNNNIIVAGGKVLPFKIKIPDWLPRKYYFLVSVFDLGDQPKYVKHLMGGNFAIRKKDALNIGFYDNELGRTKKKLAGGEEIDYQNRAHKKGYKMFYHPNQNILHKINDKLNENYVLDYAKELGRSERIIDNSVSSLKVKVKILKSHIAILIYRLFFEFIKQKKTKVYLSIISEFADGYLNKHKNIKL
ncbi:glycosyltransferase family 2 protein [Flavobacterium sp. DG2-3]|uniref:glycosyltransferase family 2 protein n=1 Tax=Flavobacterium sp. DG2-3 TaxID=3068317 RepID=UPI00273EAE73|nr:glycosyltransferase family A protein [Flavobacterium sp. DG2-3]MDP5199623.1 glycosyltransferase family A protein [Flavobacterium sp. DG2-3]